MRKNVKVMLPAITRITTNSVATVFMDNKLPERRDIF